MDSLVRSEPHPSRPTCCSRHQQEPEYKVAGAIGTAIGAAYWLAIILFIALFAGAVILNLILTAFR